MRAIDFLEEIIADKETERPAWSFEIMHDLIRLINESAALNLSQQRVVRNILYGKFKGFSIDTDGQADSVTQLLTLATFINSCR